MLNCDASGIAIGCLVVYRITLFLHQERGPYASAEAFRALVKRYGGWRLLNCFRCMSFWVALVVSPLFGRHWYIACLATSGGACVLQSAVDYWRANADALGGHE